MEAGSTARREEQETTAQGAEQWLPETIGAGKEGGGSVVQLVLRYC